MAGSHIGQTHQSPYPMFNVLRRHEPVATDTVFAETPAIGTNGATHMQFFVGRKSLVIDVYVIHTSSEFKNTLEDVIAKGERWTSSFRTVHKLRYQKTFTKSYERYASMIGNLNHTANAELC